MPSGNGVVRLYRNGVTSSFYYYGIIQIYINNDWGNICNDYYYSSTEANVICHQLRYTGASSYSRAGLVRLVTELELFPLIVINVVAMVLTLTQ